MKFGHVLEEPGAIFTNRCPRRLVFVVTGTWQKRRVFQAMEAHFYDC